MIKNLDVYIWGQKAGTLVSVPKGYKEEIVFYYDTDFAKGNLDIAPLRASIRSNSVANGFPVYSESDKLFAGLPSFIADSLPDYWGAVVFREWAQKEKIRMSQLNVLDRLAYIGRRGMGALEYLPPMARELENPFLVHIDRLYELARQTLTYSTTKKARLTADFKIESLFKVGTSAGGRRPKAILNIDVETGECYSGQSEIPGSNFVPMIIKFEEKADLPTTRIEYSYYLLAKSVGLNMMPSRLIDVEGKMHFFTERFDRKGREKIHVQTLAAMDPLADSYEALFNVAERVGLHKAEKEQLFLAMVMNVVFGNVDDHSKNFSFMMNKDGVWRLAPTYDFTFTVDPSAPGYMNGQSLTLNGKRSDITEADLLTVAREYGVAAPGRIIGKVLDAASRYDEYAREAGIDDACVGIIRREIDSRVQALR